ncbi:MAG TPA: TonB C-terminal domain-containing protein [Candidatus Acidoferrum sp.]|nr:TonB C-terminal domain-containing protein [Candidatus Acidoferrum sp.]
MIPRTLVPPDARPTKLIATPGRPTALDDRTLIPGYIGPGPLEEKTQIPAGLPLDSITARVVVPRDAKIEPYHAPSSEVPPVSKSTLDERLVIPADAPPLPENLIEIFTRPEDLVEGDVFTTGEVQLLVTPANRAERSRQELINRATTAVVYILILIALGITPTFRRQRLTTDSDEIARKNVTILLPPGLENPLPPAPPQPRIQVNPNVLRKIAPPVIPTPAPQPQPEVKPQPKQDLPSAPTPQQNAAPPAPQPKTEVASNNPLKLEIPDTPKPQQGLVLPKYGNTRPSEAVPQRPSPGFSGPRATIQNVPVPRALGGGQSGRAYGGMAMLTPDQGVDFSVYLARVQQSVERNWQAVMPESVQLGERGWVELQFKIMKDGSVPPGYPILIRSSSKEPLDRAAISSIRASNPFEPLPPAFTGPFIELRAIYLYNLPPEVLSQQ